MKNIPEKIYLVIDTDGEKVDDFKELEGVSWCTDRITPQDVPYFRKGTGNYTAEDLQEFSEWCSKSYWQFNNDYWYNTDYEHDIMTTSQLHEQWEIETGRKANLFPVVS